MCDLCTLHECRRFLALRRQRREHPTFPNQGMPNMVEIQDGLVVEAGDRQVSGDNQRRRRCTYTGGAVFEPRECRPQIRLHAVEGRTAGPEIGQVSRQQLLDGVVHDLERSFGQLRCRHLQDRADPGIAHLIAHSAKSTPAIGNAATMCSTSARRAGDRRIAQLSSRSRRTAPNPCSRRPPPIASAETTMRNRTHRQLRAAQLRLATICP